MHLSSTENPKFKQLLKLQKSRNRKKDGLILVEGEREIKIALESGLGLKQFYFCPDFGRDFAFEKEKKTILLTNDLFFKLSNRQSPDGHLAVFERPLKMQINEISSKSWSLVLVLEKPEKPGNIGAIMRSADGAGLDAVFILDSKIDLYNPNTIRASQGTVFSTPVYEIGFADLAEFKEKTKTKIFAASPSSSKNYLEASFKQKTAIMLGAEDCGLSSRALGLADQRIKIDMLGKIDSLNLSVSAGILLFEALRQKKS